MSETFAEFIARRTSEQAVARAKRVTPGYDSIFDAYRCIGNERAGYFVERRWGPLHVWIIPGTYPDDPATHYPATH